MAHPLRRQHQADRTGAPSIWTARLLRLFLWALVATGALGGACAAARPTPAVVPPRVTATDTEPPGLDGVAELAVRQWLTQQARPDGPEAASTLTVEDTSVVAARRSPSRSWAVTVAVTLDMSDGAPAIWYLEVGVTSTPAGLRAVGEPAVVSPPADALPVPAQSVALQVPASDDELAGTAEAFLRALLTGDGDPVRYASPDAKPFRPTGDPFDAVELERIGVLSSDGGRTRIRVSIRATTTDGVDFDLTYELRLRSRDGRWEVESLGSAAQPPPTSRPLPASSTTTSTIARTPGA